jgi:hypothetical protein
MDELVLHGNTLMKGYLKNEKFERRARARNL